MAIMKKNIAENNVEERYEILVDQLKERAEEMDVRNITFTQGDVGSLPFDDASFDIVVSLNGFHAFPDKETAYRETFRVLKPGGIFCGCFYVQGGNAHTDQMIRRFYIKTGYFSPPFETVESLRTRLSTMYKDVTVSTIQSIAIFQCRK